MAVVTTHSDTKPPRWDVSKIYAGLEAADYEAAMSQLESDLTRLMKLFDERRVGRLADPPADGGGLDQTMLDVIQRISAIVRLERTLEAFIYAFVSTDSYNTLAARELSKMELLGVHRQKLSVRLQGWIGSLSPFLETWIARHPTLTEHAFFLRDSARQSRYLMSEELEALAAELTVDGGVAFGKLQGNVTSQLQLTFDRGKGDEQLPITVIRNLVFDSDRVLRERAYRAEQASWESIRTPVAACLNAVKGTAVTLARRRGRASVLDAALDDNRIDRPTLDAMLESIREAFPIFRRYLRAKAGKLGLERLSWWDIFAPVGIAAKTFTWSEARQFIVEKFGTFSSEMGQYAATAFDHNWIDAEPRAGKRAGAFCMSVMGVNESRILANFDGSFEQTGTLAHELGHGYHNHCQRGLAPLLRGAPSTLAETASIFCETLVAEAALEAATPDEQLTIIESQLCGATQVCLDIYARFLFESSICERRVTSELSADDFCQLMHEAQAETYGDAVDAATYHPYMWLWKPHYYSHAEGFYNFPYAFGHLFALGLYARYRQDGDAFVPRYNGLLRATAQDYAAPLAARFGIDITRAEFWQASLKIIEKQLERYESL